MKQDLHVQYYLGGELLCLLCKWQICTGRQALSVHTTAKKAAAAGLHCSTVNPNVLEWPMSAVILQNICILA